MIDIVIGREGSIETLEEQFDHLAAAPRAQPFSENAKSFVATLSRRILADPSFRAFPELMAMAHWFRRSRVLDLQRRFEAARNDAGYTLPRGVVFHLSPSNVDSIFAYSWLLSVLCGNANVVRVSRRRTDQMDTLFSVITSLLREPSFAELAARNLVLSYDHDAVITAQISARCQLRVIWGGDRTVADIRAIPLPALASELAFANRFSMAVFNAAAVTQLGADALAALARDFCNDAFWFNQQACSSPRAVVWVGSPERGAAARAMFWAAVTDHLVRMAPENTPSQVMDRLTTVFRLAAHGHTGACVETSLGAIPTRLSVEQLTSEDRVCHDGNGLFLELERPTLGDLTPLFAAQDQTVSSFGFSREEWASLLVELPARAVDRIVPIGQALTFDSTWDGVDLLAAFTRVVRVDAPRASDADHTQRLHHVSTDELE